MNNIIKTMPQKKTTTKNGNLFACLNIKSFPGLTKHNQIN